MKVIVIGAGGQLGRAVVATLLQRGYTVCASVRRQPDFPFDSAVEVRQADARIYEQIRSVIAGFDAVVNVVGGGTLRRNDIASSATAVVVPTVEAAGIRRYIAMSAGMVALDFPIFKYVLRPLIFRHILAEHRRVETIVKASSLDWTIVRPTALTNQQPKGYSASLEPQQRTFITTRADLATFIADELENNAYTRQAVFVASCR